MPQPHLPLVLSALAFALASPAFADCESFEAISDGSQRNVEFVDHGAKGATVGDQRIGFRQVKISGGDMTGEHMWINTVVKLDEDGNPSRTIEDHVLRFDVGSIFYSVSNALVSPASDTGKPSVGDHFGAVTGGTGAYDSATGSVGIAFDGTAITYSFDIDCD